jgi:hypothetical protein
VSDDSDDDSHRKKKNTPIKMKNKSNGYPILPSMEEINGHDLKYKKQLIGTFVGDIYRS